MLLSFFWLPILYFHSLDCFVFQEWVWPIGYFLRAKVHFATLLESQDQGVLLKTVNFVKSTLSKHNVHIQTSDWKSLPELTNQNGAVSRLVTFK